MSTNTLAVQYSILAAQAATAAATDLLQHARDEGQGRFGGDVIETLAEAMRLAIAVENYALDEVLANAAQAHGHGHRIHLRKQFLEESEQLTKLFEAVKAWEATRA